MAAPLKMHLVSKFTKTSVLSSTLNDCVRATVFYTPSRGKKSKSGGSTKNQSGHAPGKGRGPVKQDGEFAYKGEVLMRQYGLTIYPGENVGIQKNNTLYALTDGTVVVSCEKLQPYPDSPLYQRVKDGLTIYKKFWNIYPIPVHAKFKLISES